MDPLGWIMALAASAWIIDIVLYVYVAWCLHTIARKTDTEHGWLAWIPIANLYLMCKIAGKPWWWLLLFFIPIVNIVILVLVWMRIAEARDKNKWIGILIIVPIGNLVMFGYLAFSGEGAQAELVGTQGNITMPPHLAYTGGVAGARGAGIQPGRQVGQDVDEREKTGTIETGKLRELEVQAKTETEGIQKSIPQIRPQVYEKQVRLVIPLSAGLEQLAQFKEHLKKVKDLTIVMTGGSVNEGSIIVVAGQEQVDLIPILNEMPMVENVHAKGETIMVMLKTSKANKGGEQT